MASYGLLSLLPPKLRDLLNVCIAMFTPLRCLLPQPFKGQIPFGRAG